MTNEAGEADTFTRLRALYQYSYTDDDGRIICMNEGDEYILLRKTCTEWWHVLKLNERLPFYVPANYVEVTYEPKNKSTDGSEEDGETSDDGVLSPSVAIPPLPDKRLSPAENHEKSRTFDQRARTPTELAERSRTFPENRRTSSPPIMLSADSGQANLASVLAQEAQNMKRLSFRPREGGDLKAPNIDSVDYVNLAEYQKAAGIGVYASGTSGASQSGAIVEDENESEYMNLTTIQQALTTSSTPPVPSPDLEPTKVISAEWNMYTDETSLRTYYYNTVTRESSWKPPRMSISRSDSKLEKDFKRSDSPVLKSGMVSRSDSGSSGKMADVTKRQTVSDDGLYGRIDGNENIRIGNGETGAKSSDDSLNSSREECDNDGSEPDIPKGYLMGTDESGQAYYINSKTNDKWFCLVDSAGKKYFYLDGTDESVWALPEVQSDSSRKSSMDSSIRELDEVRRMVAQRQSSDRHSRAKSMMATLNDSHFTPGNRNLGPTFNKRSPVAANDSNATYTRFDLEDLVTIPRADGAYSLIVRPPERRGVVNKTKIMDGGKRVNKKWSQTYIVLSGPSLLFYKDQKQSITKSGKPDTVIDLCGAEIDWASKDVTSRKNVLQVSSGSSVYLLQLDDGVKAHEWSVALRQSHDFSKQLVSDLPSFELNHPPPKQTPPAPTGNIFKRSKSTKAFSKVTGSGVDETPSNRSKIRERLLNFFLKRPPIETLQEKGIIKGEFLSIHDSVFGARISDICEREASTIPKFVRDCIDAIEQKGLTVDGIYRHSGNLATIQKLRYVIDQNEPYDLLGPDWDLHVLTGSLKLFFRELKEPVFPFQFYEQFCRASTLRDDSKKKEAVRDLVSVLPRPNYDTLKLLFHHLNNVIQNSAANRMQVQSIAIVFGPTLMWPESENANMAVNTVIQNQIIELVLSCVNSMFPL